MRFNGHLKCTNHKRKYLWLKYHKKNALHIHCIKDFLRCIYSFLLQRYAHGIFTVGRDNVLTQQKKLICAQLFDQNLGSSLIYFLHVHRTIRPNYMVLFHLFFPLCTTIRPRLKVPTDLFHLFTHDHSAKIYGSLSFILSLVHDHSTKN